MGDLADTVGVILSRVERRAEVAAQNVANLTTPGYKRAVSFESVLNPPGIVLSSSTDEGVTSRRTGSTSTGPTIGIDTASGQLQNTGKPTDLAISGAGFFSVRSLTGAVHYTRQGQFQRNDAGHLVTAQGAVLQQRGGGDLLLEAGEFQVQGDGTVLQFDDPIGRIAIVNLSDPSAMSHAEDGLYAAPEEGVLPMDDGTVIQGMLEASNVTLGAEMITIMAALREAQSGQRIMAVYDDLMGRAITTFGQG